jgi:hypothetical protein
VKGHHYSAVSFLSQYGKRLIPHPAYPNDTARVILSILGILLHSEPRLTGPVFHFVLFLKVPAGDTELSQPYGAQEQKPSSAGLVLVLTSTLYLGTHLLRTENSR